MSGTCDIVAVARHRTPTRRDIVSTAAGPLDSNKFVLKSLRRRRANSIVRDANVEISASPPSAQR